MVRKPKPQAHSIVPHPPIPSTPTFSQLCHLPHPIPLTLALHTTLFCYHSCPLHSLIPQYLHPSHTPSSSCHYCPITLLHPIVFSSSHIPSSPDTFILPCSLIPHCLHHFIQHHLSVTLNFPYSLILLSTLSQIVPSEQLSIPKELGLHKF